MGPILGGEDFGKITWFSGGERRGEIGVANRVLRGGQQKTDYQLTANEEGTYEYYRALWGNQVNFIVTQPRVCNLFKKKTLIFLFLISQVTDDTLSDEEKKEKNAKGNKESKSQGKNDDSGSMKIKGNDFFRYFFRLYFCACRLVVQPSL